MNEELRSHFPILGQQVSSRPLIYLDNAATMQVPRSVMECLTRFTFSSNANVHRGVHSLSEEATYSYEEARSSVARKIGCNADELIFTGGTTDGMNKLAAMLGSLIKPGSNMVISEMEHHSNYLPWLKLADCRDAEIRIARIDPSGGVAGDTVLNLVDDCTSVVSLTQLSNVSGVELPIHEIASGLDGNRTAFVIDGAQGIGHSSGGAQCHACDAYLFSGHKIGAPTGIGAMYVRSSLLDRLSPCAVGGGAVRHVDDSGFEIADGIKGFEAGTPNYQGAIAMASAFEFWADWDRNECLEHESELLKRLQDGIAGIRDIHIVAPAHKHMGAMSVYFDSGTSQDACKMLDAMGIAVRSGHHCAQPYIQALGLESKGALRISVAPYNTSDEIDCCLEALDKASNVLGGRP